MARTGRPPLPSKERKDYLFRIRVSDEERATIEAAAKSAGRAASEWAREILLKSAVRNGKLNRS